MERIFSQASEDDVHLLVDCVRDFCDSGRDARRLGLHMAVQERLVNRSRNTIGRIFQLIQDSASMYC